eukprot:945317-Rhodomonas_salina.3
MQVPDSAQRSRRPIGGIPRTVPRDRTRVAVGDYRGPVHSTRSEHVQFMKGDGAGALTEHVQFTDSRCAVHGRRTCSSRTEQVQFTD